MHGEGNNAWPQWSDHFPIHESSTCICLIILVSTAFTFPTRDLELKTVNKKDQPAAFAYQFLESFVFFTLVTTSCQLLSCNIPGTDSKHRERGQPVKLSTNASKSLHIRASVLSPSNMRGAWSCNHQERNGTQKENMHARGILLLFSVPKQNRLMFMCYSPRTFKVSLHALCCSFNLHGW